MTVIRYTHPNIKKKQTLSIFYEQVVDTEALEQERKDAATRHAVLLHRIRQLEAEDPETWCNMPWSEARAEWERTEGHKNEPCEDPRLLYGCTQEWLTDIKRRFTSDEKNARPIHKGPRARAVRAAARKKAEREAVMLQKLRDEGTV